MRTFFTSEAVAMGHPDKICDRIADAILDDILRQDATAHTAIEVVAAHDSLYIMGEVKTSAVVNFEKVARDTIRHIGYCDERFGFNYDQIHITTRVHEQSADIDMGVSGQEELGAGDQGIMFGYACKETENYMPLAHYLAEGIVRRLDELKGGDSFLGPDGKCQVTLEYEDQRVKRIDTIVISNQHLDSVSLAQVRQFIQEEVVEKVLPRELIDDNTVLLINPTGRFVIGGPVGDSGLTGRKIVCDTYGGYAPHGGGAFSGKDPSKVDRSAAYYLRYIAKNLVAAGLVDEVTLQAAYAIGMPRQVSMHIDTKGTEKVDLSVLYKAVEENFDLSVANIIRELDLQKPIYEELSNYGHFGREHSSFERLDKVASLRKYLA